MFSFLGQKKEKNKDRHTEFAKDAFNYFNDNPSKKLWQEGSWVAILDENKDHGNLLILFNTQDPPLYQSPKTEARLCTLYKGSADHVEKSNLKFIIKKQAEIKPLEEDIARKRGIHISTIKVGGEFYHLQHDLKSNLEKILENQTLNKEQRLKLSISILLEIWMLHKEGYFHKDVKPSNICVDEKTWKATLIDFDEAGLLGKLLDDLTGGTQLYRPTTEEDWLKLYAGDIHFLPDIASDSVLNELRDPKKMDYFMARRNIYHPLQKEEENRPQSHKQLPPLSLYDTETFNEEVPTVIKKMLWTRNEAECVDYNDERLLAALIFYEVNKFITQENAGEVENSKFRAFLINDYIEKESIQWKKDIPLFPENNYSATLAPPITTSSSKSATKQDNIEPEDLNDLEKDGTIVQASTAVVSERVSNSKTDAAFVQSQSFQSQKVSLPSKGSVIFKRPFTRSFYQSNANLPTSSPENSQRIESNKSVIKKAQNTQSRSEPFGRLFHRRKEVRPTAKLTKSNTIT